MKKRIRKQSDMRKFLNECVHGEIQIVLGNPDNDTQEESLHAKMSDFFNDIFDIDGERPELELSEDPFAGVEQFIERNHDNSDEDDYEDVMNDVIPSIDDNFDSIDYDDNDDGYQHGTY